MRRSSTGEEAQRRRMAQDSICHGRIITSTPSPRSCAAERPSRRVLFKAVKYVTQDVGKLLRDTQRPCKARYEASSELRPRGHGGCCRGEKSCILIHLICAVAVHRLEDNRGKKLYTLLGPGTKVFPHTIVDGGKEGPQKARSQMLKLETKGGSFGSSS